VRDSDAKRQMQIVISRSTESQVLSYVVEFRNFNVEDQEVPTPKPAGVNVCSVPLC
jgi:hypothetical protein